jgi:hypothetical protein
MWPVPDIKLAIFYLLECVLIKQWIGRGLCKRPKILHPKLFLQATNKIGNSKEAIFNHNYIININQYVIVESVKTK